VPQRTRSNPRKGAVPLRGTVLRVGVIAWMVLVAAGISISEEPLFGRLGRMARNGLAAVTFRPGMALFKNSVGDDKLEAHCTSVSGVPETGATVSLYAPECPRRHFLWRTDPEDQLMQRIALNTRTVELRAEQPPLTARTPRGARRFAALADFYCHADPEANYASVEIRHHRLVRNIRTGEFIDQPHVVCRFDCRARDVAAPRCALEARSTEDADAR
jgi:hypothetical protein